eukprot:UN16160
MNWKSSSMTRGILGGRFLILLIIVRGSFFNIISFICTLDSNDDDVCRSHVLQNLISFR